MMNGYMGGWFSGMGSGWMFGGWILVILVVAAAAAVVVSRDRK